MPSHCSATSASRPARAAVSTDRMVRPSSSGSSSRSACAATTCPASRIWNPVPSASSDSMSSLRWLASPASAWCCWCLMEALAIAARGGLASGPAPYPRTLTPLRAACPAASTSSQLTVISSAGPRGPIPSTVRSAVCRCHASAISTQRALSPPSAASTSSASGSACLGSRSSPASQRTECRPCPHGTSVSHGGRDVNHGPLGASVTTGTSSGAAAWRGPRPTGRRPAPRPCPWAGSAAAPAGAGSRSPGRPGGSGPGGRRATGRRCP